MSLERLKLLFVSLYPASPPRYGGQRRLEGLMKELARRHEVSAVALKYVNRLSDLLFVASRFANQKGAGDVLWVPGKNR